MAVVWASVRECHMSVRWRLLRLTFGLSLVERERRRKVAVGINLREQLVGLLLDGLDRVGASNPAQRWPFLVDDRDPSLGELRGITALLAAHRLPGGAGLGGPLGVVVDRQLGVGRRLLFEQLGAEEP